MSRSAYGRSPCWICGRRISTAGFAQHNHKMAHVRKGHYRYWESRSRSYDKYGRPSSYPVHNFRITKEGRRERRRRKDAEWREEQGTIV